MDALLPLVVMIKVLLWDAVVSFSVVSYVFWDLLVYVFLKLCFPSLDDTLLRHAYQLLNARGFCKKNPNKYTWYLMSFV